MSEKIKSIGAAVVSLVTAAFAIWWLALVANRLGVKPEVENGAVVLDQFQRAKDVLLVVLPLFSASLAYWVGSQGTEKAKKDADKATAKLQAVISTSPKEIVEEAMAKHPKAFQD
jgi:hypothetical protein